MNDKPPTDKLDRDKLHASSVWGHPIASHLGGSSFDSRRMHSVTASQALSTYFSVRCFLALGWISTSMHLLLHLTQFRMTKVRCRQFLSRHALESRGRNND